MGKALSRLEEKKRNLGMRKLGRYIDVERWLAMLDASDAEMQRLAAAWPVFRPSFVYDAVSLFGFGFSEGGPLPKAGNGEIVIRYGGWSLQDLRDSNIGKKLMHMQDWYNPYTWSRETLPPGIYRLRLPVPDSNDKNAAEQEKLFGRNENFAPVVLGATALVAHLHQTGGDLLKGDWTRCLERTVADNRAGLSVGGGRVFVGSFWGGSRDGSLWASSVRTSET